MGAIIAVANKKGEDATETAVVMLKTLKHKNVEAFGIASPDTIKTGKSIEALQKQKVNSPIVIGQAFSRVFTTDKCQPIRLENATVVFDGRIYPTNTKISDAEAVAKKLQPKHEEAVKAIINEAKSNFAFAVAEPKRLIAGRDSMGIHSFYYGENTNLVALASERKALWRIGIKAVDSFPLGHIAFINENDFKFKHVKTLAYSKAKQISLQSAAKKIQKLLMQSTKERVAWLKEVAVAFSGGLDSSIIAFLAKNLDVDVHLIHVSLENQSETKYAKRAAEELNLPIHVHLYDEKKAEKILPKVLWLIEEPDPVKTSIGIPLYWAAEKTEKMDFKVMLAGQGADELFGGYKRYINDYLRHGSERVRQIIFNDIVKMHKTNFERDYKICNFNNVELRLPFATYQIAKIATDLPIELKIEKRENGLRKLVLRQVAKNLGLPDFIVEKPKGAIQYTTGINKVIKKLAKENGLPIKEYLQKTFQTIFEKMTECD